MYGQLELLDLHDRARSLRVIEPGCAVTVYKHGDFIGDALTWPTGWHPPAELKAMHGELEVISSLVVHPAPNDRRQWQYVEPGQHGHDGNADGVPDHEGFFLDRSGNPEHAGTGEELFVSWTMLPLFPKVPRYDPLSSCFKQGELTGEWAMPLVYWIGYFTYSLLYLPILATDTLRFSLGDWFNLLAQPCSVLVWLGSFVLSICWHLVEWFLYFMYVAIFSTLPVAGLPASFVDDDISSTVFGMLALIMLAFSGLKLKGTQRFRRNVGAFAVAFSIFIFFVFAALDVRWNRRHLAWSTVQTAYCPGRFALGALIGIEEGLAYWFALAGFSKVDSLALHFPNYLGEFLFGP